MVVERGGNLGTFCGAGPCHAKTNGGGGKERYLKSESGKEEK